MTTRRFFKKNNNVFVKTQNKIILSCILIVFLILVLFSSFIFGIYKVNLFSRTDRDLQSLSRQTELALNERNDRNDRAIERLFFRNAINPRFNIFVYQNNSLILKTGENFFGETVKPNISVSDRIVNFKEQNYNFRGISKSAGSYEIIVVCNIDAELTAISRLTNILLFTFSELLLISFALSILLVKIFLEPVKKAYNEQIRFVQDASHEMRTPLTVIKGKVELLAKNQKDTIEDQFLYISQLMSEIKSLERLNKDLLDLSKQDIESNEDITSFELSKPLVEIYNFYRDLAASQNKKLILNCGQKEFLVDSNYSKIKQALTILIENALRYTRENDEISLNYINKEKNAVLEVSDTGIGISEEDIPHIFERFYRSDSVRGEYLDGSGIGLSILKSLADSLGFKIKVDSKLNEGTAFSLIFKR